MWRKKFDWCGALFVVSRFYAFDAEKVRHCQSGCQSSERPNAGERLRAGRRLYRARDLRIQEHKSRAWFCSRTPLTRSQNPIPEARIELESRTQLARGNFPCEDRRVTERSIFKLASSLVFIQSQCTKSCFAFDRRMRQIAPGTPWPTID